MNSVRKIVTNYLSDEWVEDFKMKYDMLKSHFDESCSEDMYVDIFQSLKHKCHLLIDQWQKFPNVTYDSLIDYVIKYDTVFIYPQTFESYYKGKYYPKDIEAVISFKCIVVDIDEVTSSNIYLAISKIKAMAIQPNYVVNSGNGLHLYYIFSEMHNMKGSIGLIAYHDDKTQLNKCLTQNIIYHEKYQEYRDLYSKVKNGMICWFDDLPMKADHKNHLVQPIRLFNSKTKNPNIYTQIFRITNVKHSFQEIASRFGIELPEESVIRDFVKFSNSIKNKKRYEKTKKKNEQEAKKISTVPTSNTQRNFHFDREEFTKQMLADELKEKESEEYKFFQRLKDQREKVFREKYSEKKPLSKAQGKGRLSQYHQFKNIIKNSGKVGNRRNCLYVFWNRAHQYTKNKDMILLDYNEIADHFRSLSYSHKLTDAQINEILKNDSVRLRDDTIYRMTGVRIVFERKQDQLRKTAKEQTKLKKDSERQRIIEIASDILIKNPLEGYRGLSDVLKLLGINKSFKTLSMMEEIRRLKSNASNLS